MPARLDPNRDLITLQPMERAGGGTVIVIAKSPEPGRVKTRLCPPCDPAQAASIAAACLEDTFIAADGSSATRRVVALDGPPGSWIPDGYEVVRQVDGGLGERLDAALRWAASTDHGHSPSMILGMDTPQVGAMDIDRALSVLHEPGVDAVLGPAVDGGYWTIGFTAEAVVGCSGLFDGVPMSTSRTAEAQLRTLGSMGLRARVLPVIRDIDTWHDALVVARGFPDLATSGAIRALQSAHLLDTGCSINNSIDGSSSGETGGEAGGASRVGP